MRFYLDTSVALHAILPGGDERVADWLDSVRHDGGELFSSTLLHVEMARVLRRDGLDVALCKPVLDRVGLVSIDDAVIRSAVDIEPHAKSLDAIHLATCSLLGSDVTLVTHDATMEQAAVQLGLDPLDPL